MKMPPSWNNQCWRSGAVGGVKEIYWIHEGIGTFGDALYTRDMEGEAAYEKIFQHYVPRIRNDKPIVLGKDITEDDAYHPDIYPKGAFFIHTLRYIMGDSIFFPAIRHIATDSNHTYIHSASTAEVEQTFEQASGMDLSQLFHLYLYTTDKLEIRVRPTDSTHY